MFGKKAETDLMKIFSNENLIETLNKLHWQKASNDKHVWEFVKLKSLEGESLILAMIIATLPRRPLGEYNYTVVGSRLERYNPKIIPPKYVKQNTVRNLGPYDFDLEKKGVVTKVE